MIDATLIKAVADLATQAARPNIVEVPGQSKGIFLLWNPAENKYEIGGRSPDRSDQFTSLPTLADYAVVREDDALVGSFWYSRAGVVYVDGTDWLNRATLPLTLSAPIQQLQRWTVGHEKLKQSTAVLKLRTLFAGAAFPGDLLTIVQGVAWKVDEAGRSVVKQGERSVGRTSEARLEGRDKIPDVVVFEVPVWENGGALIAGITAKVRCALDADPTDQTFMFVPEAGAVEAAIGYAEAELESRLRGQIDRAFGEAAKPPVYHGTPTKV